MPVNKDKILDILKRNLTLYEAEDIKTLEFRKIPIMVFLNEDDEELKIIKEWLDEDNRNK